MIASKNNYSKFFVPPKFLEMSSVAVEINEYCIRYMSVKKDKRGLLPDKYGTIAIPKGIFRAGEIVKKGEVVKILKDIAKITDVTFARISISEDNTYIFKTKIPKVDKEEIKQVLEFKLEENIPLALAETVFDYQHVNKGKVRNYMDFIVSAAPLKNIQLLTEVFEEAGLAPILFRTEASNVARSVVKDNNEQTLIVVNIKEFSIALSLVIGGVVWQTSSINFGAATFNESLRKYYDISVDEAEKVKVERLYEESSDSMEIFSYLINTVSAVKDEIYRFMLFCNQREDVKDRIDKIILCGKDSAIVGLQKYLELNLGVSTHVANVWVNNFLLDDYVPEMKPLESLDYVTVIGLNLD